MLWREPYAPRVLEGVEVPFLDAMPLYPGAPLPGRDFALIGGFSGWAIGEMGTWTRLFLDGNLPAFVAFIDQIWSPQAVQDLGNSIASSAHRTTLVVSDSQDQWRTLIQPDKPERAFAAIIRDSVAEMLVIGPPTEDVWEEFARRLRPA
jgi:hypothetical protein